MSGPTAVGRPTGVGVGAAFRAAVDPLSVEFLAVTPSTNVFGDLNDPDVTQHLIAIDPDDGSTRVVSEVALLDPDTPEVTFVATDVFTVEKLVGAELNPRTGELFVVRNGGRLLAIDLATGVERDIATLTVEVGGEELPVATDNLAMRRLDCAAGCTRTIGYYRTHGCDPKRRNENEIQPLLGAEGVWLGQPDPDDPGEPRGDSVPVRESRADDDPVEG